MIETLLAITLVFFIAFAFLLRSYLKLRVKLMQAVSGKHSLSTKYGKMTEQFMPFLKNYPYDENKFRFLGTPVDGVQFNEDGIVFVEFKTAGSRMSPNQRGIKELVEKNKVTFEEIRMDNPD